MLATYKSIIATLKLIVAPLLIFTVPEFALRVTNNTILEPRQEPRAALDMVNPPPRAPWSIPEMGFGTLQGREEQRLHPKLAPIPAIAPRGDRFVS
jgi:hypothetical protein